MAPRGDQPEKMAERPLGRKEFIEACLGGSVISACRHVHLEMAVPRDVVSALEWCKLSKRLKGGYIGLGWLCGGNPHISANQATAVGVITQPPMPTLFSSAQTSAAAKHCRVEGMAKGLCGL